MEKITESSILQLSSNTGVFFGADRKNNSKSISSFPLTFTPMVYSNKLMVESKTSSSLGTKYTTRIEFSDVEFSEPSINTISVEGVDGATYSFFPISNRQNDVKLSCNCLDFYYRFSKYNEKDDSLYGGSPPPYVKKTDRPPVNPDKIPGMCKHLLRLSDQLLSIGVLKK